MLVTKEKCNYKLFSATWNIYLNCRWFFPRSNNCTKYINHLERDITIILVLYWYKCDAYQILFTFFTHKLIVSHYRSAFIIWSNSLAKPQLRYWWRHHRIVIILFLHVGVMRLSKHKRNNNGITAQKRAIRLLTRL